MLLKASCHCQAVRFEVESHTPYPFLRCFCSICRKTAGGGGFAINIMGDANTLKVKGRRYIQVYQAITSQGRRHFCKKCGSCLWVSDPSWPELIHPFASAIDSPLPKPPEHINIMLKFAANWVDIPKGKRQLNYDEYNEESIEDWHRRHDL
jgi:hypothetical protein